MVNSREKGKRAEREIAAILREKYGFADVRRGQQFAGIEGEDIVGLPMLHCEIKNVQKLNLREAMAQSERDAKEGQIPVVMHKKDRKPWLVTLNLKHFMWMYKCWLRWKGRFKVRRRKNDVQTPGR